MSGLGAWDRGREERVLGTVAGSMMRIAVSSFSVLARWVSWESWWGERVELVVERKRDARAKRWRFCRTRMSQSTSSSRISAVVRFCSTTLVRC